MTGPTTRRETFDSPAFALRLREAIEASAMTQRQLAEELSVHPNRVTGWVRGHGLPKLHQLVELAERLDVPLDWLLTGRREARAAERRLVGELAELAPSLAKLATRAQRMARP